MADLTQQLRDLNEQLRDLRKELRVDYTPRQETRMRMRRNFWAILAIMALVVAVAVGINRITLLQAQRDFGERVTHCFLRPGAVSAAQARACDRQFSTGKHEYLQTQERSAQAGRQFVDLQRWARSKGWKPPK